MATIPASPCLRSRRPPPPLPPSASRLADRTTVVSIVGDLDLASGDHWREACTAACGPDVRVDLSATTFIDCYGYSALAAARQTIEARGGTLTLRGVSGTLAQLLTLIREAQADAGGRPVAPHRACTRKNGR